MLKHLFDKNTSYKKKKVLWFKVTYGLKIPSDSKLQDLTKSLVNGGRFINKNRYKTANQRVNLIKSTNKNQAVYLQ